jgi:hypothetical protein
MIFINIPLKDLSPIDNLIIDSFSLIYTDMIGFFKKAKKSEDLGKDKLGTKYWDNMNDIMYLNTYLFICKKKIADDLSSGVSKTYFQYEEEFDLDCIKKRFLCEGVDIHSLLELYGLTNSTFNSGINFMNLQPDSSSLPKFIIG